MRFSTAPYTSSFGLHVLVLLNMWNHFGWYAAAQRTTLQPSAVASAVVTPSLVFAVAPTATACSTVEVEWRLTGVDPKLYDINLRVLNVGVDQSIPSPSSSAGAPPVVPTSARGPNPVVSSAAALAAFVDDRSVHARASVVNQSIATATALVHYDWKVAVPQGRYFLTGVINDAGATSAKSLVFTVLEGSDTSCLAAFENSPVSSSSSSSTSGTSAMSTRQSRSSTTRRPASSAAASGSSGTTDGDSGINTGAIVGIVIAVVGSLALLLISLICLRRRRRARSNVSSSLGAEPNMRDRPRSSSVGNTFATGPVRRSSRYGRMEERSPIALTSMDGSQEYQEKEELYDLPTGSVVYGDGTPPYLAGYGSHAGDATPPRRSLANPFATTSNTPQTRDAWSFPPDDLAAAPRRTSEDYPPTSSGAPGGGKPLGRSGSTRRKPVPSLGPELLDTMEKEASRRPSETLSGQKDAQAGSFQLTPDSPRPAR